MPPYVKLVAKPLQRRDAIEPDFR